MIGPLVHHLQGFVLGLVFVIALGAAYGLGRTAGEIQALRGKGAR